MNFITLSCRQTSCLTDAYADSCILTLKTLPFTSGLVITSCDETSRDRCATACKILFGMPSVLNPNTSCISYLTRLHDNVYLYQTCNDPGCTTMTGVASSSGFCIARPDWKVYNQFGTGSFSSRQVRHLVWACELRGFMNEHIGSWWWDLIS